MITWDEAKQQQNIAKHGVDFSIAEEVLSGITVLRKTRGKTMASHVIKHWVSIEAWSSY